MSQNTIQAELVKSLQKEGIRLELTPGSLASIMKNFNPAEPHKNTLWTTDPKVELPILLRKEDIGSEKPITFNEYWQESLSSYGNAKALAVKNPENNKWNYLTYKEFYITVKNFAMALIHRNISERSSVAILGYNDPCWMIGFHGTILANCVNVGLYLTNQADACHYVLEHADSEVVLVDSETQMNKVLEVWSKLPKLKYMVYWGADFKPEKVPQKYKNMVFTWKDFVNFDKNADLEKNLEKALHTRIANQGAGSCCVYVYTSGTTGNPKGVMQSHDNFTWLSKSIEDVLNSILSSTVRPRIISYLPLSHVAAQFMDIIFPLKSGACVYFADDQALKGTLKNYLADVQPTIFMGVPRIWEKIEESLRLAFESKPRIIAYTQRVVSEGNDLEMKDQPTSFMYKVLKKTVLKKIKKQMGLQHCEHFIVGAAPLSQASQKFFFSLGIFINNMFGMSETAGPYTGTMPTNLAYYNLKSVGVPARGSNCKVDNPDNEGNGELCFRSRSCFMGYLKDDKATKESIDGQRFLHSGDIGRFDQYGNLLITGRLKELIITAGGENVAPILIEDKIKEVMPFLSNSIVIGDRRKYLVAILTLKTTGMATDLPVYTLAEDAKENLKKYGCIDLINVQEALNDPLLKKAIDKCMSVVNQSVISKAQWIQKWTIVMDDFTIPGGELTPTLKTKRRIIMGKYRSEIEEMYLGEPKL